MITDVPIDTMSTRELATAIFHMREHQKVTNREIFAFESVLKARMEEMGTEALADQKFDIRMRNSGSPQYDVHKLRAGLGEVLTPEEIGDLIQVIPATEKVSGTVARSLKTKYRGSVAEVIEAAQIEPNKRLTVKPK